MKNLFWLFIPLLWTNAFSQVNWRAEQNNVNITNEVLIFEDVDGQLKIEKVSSHQYDNLFKKYNHPLLNLGFNTSFYWIKFNLNNETNDSLFLELDNAFIPYAELYYKSGSRDWNSIVSGYKVNLKDKIIKDHFQLFPLPSGEHQFLIRIQPYLHPIAIKVLNKDTYELKVIRQRLIYGVYTGILLFAIAINIFLFFTLRRSYYILYAILVFLYSCSSAAVLEGYLIYFFPKADLMFWYITIPILDMPALLFYCITFLEVKKISPSLYKVVFIFACSLGIYSIILHFLPLLVVLIANQVLSLIVFIVTIAIGIVVGKKGNKLGYYFTITYAIFFLLLCAEEIYIQIGEPKHILDLSYVSIAIFIETFLLAFLLAKRFQWEKVADEKVKIGMQRNILEIQERYKQEIMRVQLEVQEHTFQTISQELHDNIGQMLTLVKLNLNMIELNESGAQNLENAKTFTSQVIQGLRDLSKSLNGDKISKIGIGKAVENELAVIAKLTGLDTKFQNSGLTIIIDPQVELILFRVIQESLHNIIKHAKASSIEVSMICSNAKLDLTIIDNGIGFDVNRDDALGSGLGNMRKRCKLIGAEFIVESEIGKGTAVSISFSIELPQRERIVQVL